MKVAYSNLSWDLAEDQQVIELLNHYNISGVELACSKIWSTPENVSSKKAQEYREKWNNNGIDIVAITSLLYGHPELTLFKDAESRKKTLTYLTRLSETASALGAKIMMFGSPKNRIKGNLTTKEADTIAAEFFQRLADNVALNGVSVVIEPNPSIYGGDYILNFDDAIRLCKLVDHKNFGINIDSSTIASNNSNYYDTVQSSIAYGLHAHISEPYLKPLSQSLTNHTEFALALTKNGYSNWLAIEVVLHDNIDHMKEMKRTLEFVTQIYK